MTLLTIFHRSFENADITDITKEKINLQVGNRS